MTRDNIRKFRRGDSVSAKKLNKLRMAATNGIASEDQFSDATGISRRRGRRQSTTTYLVRATEQIDGYTISSGTKTVYSGLCQVLAVDTSDGTIDVSARGNIIDVYNPFITIVTYSSADDNDFVVVKDKHGIYWVASNPAAEALATAEAERIRFLVKGAVALATTSFTVDNVEVVGPSGSTSPVADASEELTVYRDTGGYTVDDNAIGRAEQDESSGNWVAYVLDENCP